MNRILFFIVLIIITACNKNDLQTCNDDIALFSLADFPIGVAVSPFELANNTEYRTIVTTQFNRITPGNVFKPDALHPTEGDFTFEIADSLVAFAEQNGKRIHGHTLLWHNQLPAWMNNFSGDRADWILMMENHIKTIVAHFGNEVEAWDVLNEAFEDNGDFRENIWFQNIGEDYIALAFEFARQANPDVLLFYNDYNIATKSNKCQAILNHFKKLKSAGVPVDGIGMQLHIYTSTPSNTAIEKTVEELVKADFLIHFSEVDISMNLSGNGMNLTDNKRQKQGKKMQSLVNIFQSIPSSQQYGITVWGVSDLDSWIPSFFNREDYPLMFDNNYEPKLMYCGFVNGLTD